jgi:hypothetical protein
MLKTKKSRGNLLFFYAHKEGAFGNAKKVRYAYLCQYKTTEKLRFLDYVDLANNLVAANATSANVLGNYLAFLYDADLLNIDLPMTGALAIAVADVVACHGALAADAAHS